YRKGYFDRAVIMTHEEEKYKKFVDKMKNLPKIKHAINPNISIYKQLPDTKKAQKDKTNILKRVELAREYKKDLLKSKTDRTYTIPKTKSGRGLGTRVAQAVDIANKLGAIIDLRQKIKERDNIDNEFRQNFEKWFDVNFRQYYVQDLPNPIKASEIFTIEKFRKAYNDLVNKGILAENELQKLKKSMLDTGYPDSWYQVSLTRAEHFNLANFLFGYAYGEQLQFVTIKKRDEIREEEPRMPRDDELVIPEGGRSDRFGEYKGLSNETLRQHLEKRKFDSNKFLSIKLTYGYKGISDSKNTKFLTKVFDKLKKNIRKTYKKKVIEDL